MSGDANDTGRDGGDGLLACRELVEIVTEYLEGALSSDERARVEAHLSDCAGCTAYVEQMRETIRLTGRLREHDLPAPVRQALLRAFHASRSER